MGNYIFNTEILVEELLRDGADEESRHDFGRNILPSLIGRRKLGVYDFSKNEIPGMDERERGYWRDVGTLASYFSANMDLVAVHPIFNLYNDRWPMLTWSKPMPPAKFVFSEAGRVGMATDSMVSEGCIISGGRLDRTVLSPNVRVNSFSYVEQSILFEGAQIGRHARIRRAIIDKGVTVPEGMEVGYDHEADRRRGLTVVDEDDLVVIPKNFKFE
jgi:glucose-1-phosphate adenylyltransferase